MTWQVDLVKQPERAKRTWTGNPEIEAVWSDHVKRGYAENTHRNYTQDVRIFCSMWKGTLVTTLKSPDIDVFVDAISLKCSKLQNGATPACFAKHDMATCPLIRPGAGQSGTSWVETTKHVARNRFSALEKQLVSLDYNPKETTFEFFELAMGLTWDFSRPFAGDSYHRLEITRKRPGQSDD